MPATTRCPRCAYALTGLPGAPSTAHAYGEFTADERCPECALQIPAGAHCLVGGVTPDVVDASGSRSLMSIVGAGALLIGGPFSCILIGVVLVNVLRGTTLRGGVPMSALQSWTIGGVPFVLGISLTAWFIWRTWRRTGTGSDGERAGARMRRAMVVPGGVHLWSGEPTLDAKARSLAGGDVRDVRGRRHIPLFRKKGAAETIKKLSARPVESFFRIFAVESVAGDETLADEEDERMSLQELQQDIVFRLRDDVVPRASMYYINQLHGFDDEDLDDEGEEVELEREDWERSRREGKGQR